MNPTNSRTAPAARSPQWQLALRVRTGGSGGPHDSFHARRHIRDRGAKRRSVAGISRLSQQNGPKAAHQRRLRYQIRHRSAVEPALGNLKNEHGMVGRRSNGSGGGAANAAPVSISGAHPLETSLFAT